MKSVSTALDAIFRGRARGALGGRRDNHRFDNRRRNAHDGRRLAIPASISGDRIGTATVKADGTGYKLLRINDRTLSAGCFVWSPNDRVLACESWDDTRPGRSGIYLLPSASGGTPCLYPKERTDTAIRRPSARTSYRSRT